VKPRVRDPKVKERGDKIHAQTARETRLEEELDEAKLDARTSRLEVEVARKQAEKIVRDSSCLS